MISFRREIVSAAGMLAMFPATVWPDSMLADGLRVLGWSIMSVGFVLLARTGYLKRRPFWTADSWRRYLLVCSIPVGALVIVAGMMVALEMRLPMVGPPRSGLRSAWIAGTLVFMLVGAGGLAVAMTWLADGEPSRQCTWPKWLQGGSGKAPV